MSVHLVTMGALQRLSGWLRRPGAPLLAGTGFESTRYLTKWLLLGTAIGLVAGLGAVAFYQGIDWRATLQRGVRRTQRMPEASSLFEVRLQPGSPLVGRTLREARLPEHTLVVAVQRQTETIFPTASTCLEPDDVLTILADPNQQRVVAQFFDVVAQ